MARRTARSLNLEIEGKWKRSWLREELEVFVDLDLRGWVLQTSGRITPTNPPCTPRRVKGGLRMWESTLWVPVR